MDMGGSRTAGKPGKGMRKAAEPQGEYHVRSASEIAKEIKRMEEQMFQHAGIWSSNRRQHCGIRSSSCAAS